MRNCAVVGQEHAGFHRLVITGCVTWWRLVGRKRWIFLALRNVIVHHHWFTNSLSRAFSCTHTFLLEFSPLFSQYLQKQKEHKREGYPQLKVKSILEIQNVDCLLTISADLSVSWMNCGWPSMTIQSLTNLLWFLSQKHQQRMEVVTVQSYNITITFN